MSVSYQRKTDNNNREQCLQCTTNIKHGFPCVTFQPGDSGCNGSDLANLDDRSIILPLVKHKEKYTPPPTRHMTFFVVESPALPERVIVVSRQVTIFLLNAVENAYCALISSPSLGIFRRGGSMRSINSPCEMLFTTAPTSTSKGSLTLLTVYSCRGVPSNEGVNAPARDAGLEDTLLGVPSL